MNPSQNSKTNSIPPSRKTGILFIALGIICALANASVVLVYVSESSKEVKDFNIGLPTMIITVCILAITGLTFTIRGISILLKNGKSK